MLLLYIFIYFYIFCRSDKENQSDEDKEKDADDQTALSPIGDGEEDGEDEEVRGRVVISSSDYCFDISNKGAAIRILGALGFFWK